MVIEGPLSPPPLHAIFVDSSIGTHFAMAVSIRHTIRTVKAKIMAEHVLCFKDLGEISIQAIKVKRRGFFYNLADSMPVLNAFDGVRGSWFLYIDVVIMCPVKNQKIVCNQITSAHIEQHFHEGVVVSSSVPGKTSCTDGHGSHISILNYLDNDQRSDMLIDQEKDKEKKRRKMAKYDLHDRVSDMNSNNPPNDMPCNLCEISNLFVEQDLEIGAPSLPASEDQVKSHCCSRKKSKSERIEYSKISDLVLPKSNGEVTKSNEGRESDPSNLSNRPNQKLEQLHLDATMVVPLLDEDPLKLAIITQPKGIGVTSLPASNDQAKPSCSRKKSMNERSKLKSPEISDVVLPKSSCEVIESNEGRETGPSKLSNEPNQKIGKLHVDAMMSVPLVDEDSLKRTKIPQLKESGVPLLTFSKDKVKPCHSKKKSMNEQSKLKSPEISHLVLPKFNGKVNESNEERGSDTSSLANGSNQNQEQHHSDAKSSVPLLDEDLLKLARIPQLKGIGIPSLQASEDQAKPRYSRKRSKCERSKLKSPEIRDVVLPNSNCKVIKSNEGGFDPSNFDNGSDQKIKQHYGDTNNSTPLFDEDLLARNPQPNLLDPCEASDGLKLIKEGYVTTHILSLKALTDANMYNSDKNKSEKKVLRVSSEVREHLELCRNDNTNLNLNDDPIPEQVKPPENDTSHHNLEKKLLCYVSQNSGDIETKQGEKVIDASNDESVHYNELHSSTRNNIVCDAAGLNTFDFSQNQGPTNQAESTESTKDTPHHLRRFKVVRKIPIRRHKRRIINN